MTESSTAPIILTPDEAKARFGELLVGSDLAKTYQSFETPEGDWRPEFGSRGRGYSLVLTGYRFYPLTKSAPASRPGFKRKPRG